MKKNIVIIILVILSLGLGIGLFVTYNELSNQKEEIEELEEKIDTYKKDNKNYKDDKEEGQMVSDIFTGRANQLVNQVLTLM